MKICWEITGYKLDEIFTKSQRQRARAARNDESLEAFRKQKKATKTHVPNNPFLLKLFMLKLLTLSSANIHFPPYILTITQCAAA